MIKIKLCRVGLMVSEILLLQALLLGEAADLSALSQYQMHEREPFQCHSNNINRFKMLPDMSFNL